MKNAITTTTLSDQAKVVFGIFAFAITALAETAFGSGTNTWNNAAAPGGNTPATAYDWSDPNNWNDKSYAPTAFGDGANLGSAATAPRFIRLPALGAFGLTLASWANNNHLLGDFVFGDDPAGTFRATSYVNANSILYGDFYLNSLKQEPYVGAFAIAGYFRSANENPLGRSQVKTDWGRTDELTMRMDLFADSSNPVRNAPILDSGTELANAGFLFVGPRGAPAQSGTWSQTAESTYLNVVSMDGVVAPGSIVTGGEYRPAHS